MDPNACFSELLEALADDDDTLAQEHAVNLTEWLARGGFYPCGELVSHTAIDAFLEYVSAQ